MNPTLLGLFGKGRGISLFILKITNFKTFQLYITSIIFYYYFNKKIHYKTKFFHFSIQILFTLYHIYQV